MEGSEPVVVGEMDVQVSEIYCRLYPSEAFAQEVFWRHVSVNSKILRSTACSKPSIAHQAAVFMSGLDFHCELQIKGRAQTSSQFIGTIVRLQETEIWGLLWRHWAVHISQNLRYTEITGVSRQQQLRPTTPGTFRKNLFEARERS